MAEDYQKLNKAPQQQQQLEPGESAMANTSKFDDNSMRDLVRSITIHKELKVGASLVGLTVEEATKKINEEVGEEVKIEVIPMGFRSCIRRCKPDRVKLKLDSSGRVVSKPYIG
ncbi:unnamed protein product [Citrullus colocynthis]|uniref:Uncharacterized protein n=1 Tax=Citrullus colocynthis TaxID=252529 RepID=A0ABP0YHW0_9ROSI